MDKRMVGRTKREIIVPALEKLLLYEGPHTASQIQDNLPGKYGFFPTEADLEKTPGRLAECRWRSGILLNGKRHIGDGYQTKKQSFKPNKLWQNIRFDGTYYYHILNPLKKATDKPAIRIITLPGRL